MELPPADFKLSAARYEYLLEETQAMLASSLIYPYHAQQLHELPVVRQSTQGTLSSCHNSERTPDGDQRCRTQCLRSC